MKIRISQKNIRRILIIVAFLGGFISLLAFLWERDFKYDKYGDFVSSCIQEKKIVEINLNCHAFLELIDRKEKKEVCLHLLTIDSNTNVVPFIICENASRIIGLENSDLYSKKKVPIDIELKYKRGLLQNANLNSIRIYLMSDSDLFSLLSSLSQKSVFLSNVRSQADLELEKIKFFTHPLDIKEMEDIWFLMMWDVIVKDSYLKEGKMFFELEVLVKDYKFNIEVTSDAILLTGKEPPEKIVNKENISEVTIGGRYHAGFLYVPIGTVINEEKVRSLCDSSIAGNTIVGLFCDSKRTKQSLLLEEDIEKYLKTLAEKESSRVDNLMFFLLEKYE